MKTILYRFSAALAISLCAITLPTSAQTVCPDLEIDFTAAPFNDAVTGNWMDGVPLTFDVIDANGANGTDGVIDITITPTVVDCSNGRFNFNLGDINGTSSSGVGNQFRTGPNCGNIAGDAGYVQFDIVFADHLCLSLSQVSRLSATSLNGGSEGYEWGAVQILAPGGTMGYGDGTTQTPILRPVAQGGTAGFKDYNIDDYGHGSQAAGDLTGDGDITGLIPDLFTAAEKEGISFNAAANTMLIDGALDADNDGNESGTGSHQSSIAATPFGDVGAAENNFFSAAPADGPIGGFVFTHGLVLTAGNANHNIAVPLHDCFNSALIDGQQPNGQNTLPIANFSRLSIGTAPPTCGNLPLADLGECVTLPLPDSSVLGVPAVTAGCDIVMINTADSVPVNVGCSQLVTRTFTFIDECGGMVDCTQQIRYNADTTAPVITCAPLMVMADPASMSVTLTTNDFLSFITDMNDNGGMGCGLTVTIDGGAEVTLSCADGGNRTAQVTVEATDSCGNSVSAVCDVELMGCCMPNLMCPADLSFNCPNEVPAPDLTAPTADACATLVHVADINRGGSGCAGNPMIIERIYRAEAPGVSESCRQLITVEEPAPRAIECPSDLTLPNPGVPPNALPLQGSPIKSTLCP